MSNETIDLHECLELITKLSQQAGKVSKFFTNTFSQMGSYHFIWFIYNVKKLSFQICTNILTFLLLLNWYFEKRRCDCLQNIVFYHFTNRCFNFKINFRGSFNDFHERIFIIEILGADITLIVNQQFVINRYITLR